MYLKIMISIALAALMVAVLLPGQGVFLLDFTCMALLLFYYGVHDARSRMAVASIASRGPRAV